MSRKILFYGDSNTLGYRPGGERLPANRRYTTMVTRQAPDVIPLVNAVNGRSTAWDFPGVSPELLGGAMLTEALNRTSAPDGLVIMLGTNDVMPPYNTKTEEIMENLRRMVQLARTTLADIAIVLVSPPPLGDRAIKDCLARSGVRQLLTADLSLPMEQLASEEGVFFLSGSSIVSFMDAEDGFLLADVGHLRLGLALGSLLRSIGPFI